MGYLKPMQTTYEVSRFSELINVLRTIRNVYAKYNNPVMESLWYRGQSSSNTSSFRRCFANTTRTIANLPCPDYQRKLLEYFLMATKIHLSWVLHINMAICRLKKLVVKCSTIAFRQASWTGAKIQWSVCISRASKRMML